MATFEDFQKLEIRVGVIDEVFPFPEARKRSYRITVDFGGEIGKKTSSAQFPAVYKAEDLIGYQVLCVTNLPPRKIGPVLSEVLILGVPDDHGNAVIIQPERKVPLGGRLF